MNFFPVSGFYFPVTPSSAGLPLASTASIKRRNPRDQRRSFKNSLRTGNQHQPRRFASPASTFDDVVWEFVAIGGEPREMPSQQQAGVLDRFHERIREGFTLEMRAHAFDQTLPELLATFLVYAFVSDNSKFLRTRRH
jgi:hypothetical protein